MLFFCKKAILQLFYMFFQSFFVILATMILDKLSFIFVFLL